VQKAVEVVMAVAVLAVAVFEAVLAVVVVVAAASASGDEHRAMDGGVVLRRDNAPARRGIE
jgi:hypothetical protein